MNTKFYLLYLFILEHDLLIYKTKINKGGFTLYLAEGRINVSYVLNSIRFSNLTIYQTLKFPTTLDCKVIVEGCVFIDGRI